MGYMKNIYIEIEERVKDLERRKIVIKDCQDWLRGKKTKPETPEVIEVLKEIEKEK